MLAVDVARDKKDESKNRGISQLITDGWEAPLTDRQFNFIRELAKIHAGIAIADYKRNMVYRRISKRLRALGLEEIQDYCEILSGPRAEQEMELFINALTTNKTELFRERHHFDHMTSFAFPKFLDNAARRGHRRLRIWSAGCSSGEEPYSIALTMHECIPELAQWDARILATDIDTEMVEKGREGIYPVEAIDALPAHVRSKYVEPIRGDKTKQRMTAALRDSITFKPLNLLESWPMKGPFDFIFCRNVVIYFDKPTQQVLFDRFASILRDGSYLYIGHSESLYRVTERFRAVGKSIYQKVA